MGINTESDIGATLTVGPTSEGMVRLFIETDAGAEVPMDFSPDEAVEIAEEIRAAAEVARRASGGGGAGRGDGGNSRRARRDRRRDDGH